MSYRILELLSRLLKEQALRISSLKSNISATSASLYAQVRALIARAELKISRAMLRSGSKESIMRSEIVFSSVDLLVATCNNLAKSNNVREDGVFTVDMLRSKFAVFILSQQNDDLARAFSKFVLESVERDKKTIEEVYNDIEENNVQSDPV